MQKIYSARARLRVYFGKACAKHPELNGERRIPSGLCVQCQRDHQRVYFRKYRERRLRQFRQWLCANAAYSAARNRRYRAENGEAYNLARRIKRAEKTSLA